MKPWKENNMKNKKSFVYYVSFLLGFIGEAILFGCIFFITCAILEALINLALKFIM